MLTPEVIVQAGSLVEAQHRNGHKDMHELMRIKPEVKASSFPLAGGLKPALGDAQHIDGRPRHRANLQVMSSIYRPAVAAAMVLCRGQCRDAQAAATGDI